MSAELAAQILQHRLAPTSTFPSLRRARGFSDRLLELLFPQLAAEAEYFTRQEIEGEISLLGGELRKLLRPLASQMPTEPDEVVARFFAGLPEVYRLLWLDAQAILDGDPAAGSVDEVIAAYPGFFAIGTYRIAHGLHEDGVPLLPRVLTEHAHLRTGIDIHPGARIGEAFCIDHGTGIVIGESTEIGDRVKVYQGVSLGALSVSKGMARTKRHPTVGDDVVIYGNATILGGDTVIGHHSVIGGNVWLTRSVPPWSLVVHEGEVRVRPRGGPGGALDFQI